MNIVDYIIIGLFLIGMVNGFRKGFLGSLVGIFGSIVGLITAYKCYPYLTGWADHQFQVLERLNRFLQEGLVLPQSVAKLKIALPTQGLADYLDKITLPAALKTQLIVYLQGLEETVGPQASSLLGDILHRFLATVIINGLAFLIIWFVITGFFQVIAALFSRMTQHSILGGLDRVGGLLLGAALTALTLTIMLGLAAPLLNAADLAEPSFFSGVFKTIGEAWLVPYFISLYSFFAARVGQILTLAVWARGKTWFY